MKKENNLFEELYEIDVSEKVEKKNGLDYLSWAYAWAEVMKRDENAIYEIERFGEGKKPYLYDELLGYMVFTNVTIFGKTCSMWLPVMDSVNKAMLDHQYTYEVNKYDYDNKTGKRTAIGKDTKTVEPATMFDINKTLMRCLVKNIAMFGLGLKLYTGEDLPEQDITTKEEAEKYVLTFGKYQNKTLKEVIENDSKYIDWLFNNERTDQIIKKCITLITGQVESDTQSGQQKENVKTASPKQISILLQNYKGENLNKLLEVNNITKIEEISMSKASELIGKIMNQQKIDEAESDDLRKEYTTK